MSEDTNPGYAREPDCAVAVSTFGNSSPSLNRIHRGNQWSRFLVSCISFLVAHGMEWRL